MRLELMTKDMANCLISSGFCHSYISPISYLDMIPVKKTPSVHLLLAHLLDSDIYCEYYRSRKEAGDVIIVDNGAFEFHEPMPVDKYNKLIKSRLGFDVDMVVAPDYPFQPSRVTIEATNDFIQSFDDHFDRQKTKIMAVPQSTVGDYVDWMKCYANFVGNDRISAIGMSILGIPNAFRSLTGTTDISYNRRVATSMLISLGVANTDKWHHYLGCGDPREVVDMIAQGLAASNDSSTAIWHGILGISFDATPSGLIEGKNKTPVDFYQERIETRIDTINHNISYLEAIMKSTKMALHLME